MHRLAVGRVADELRVLAGLVGDMGEDRRVLVEVLPGVGLGGLQGERLGHHVRVVAGPVVHAEVRRADADLLGVDAGLLGQLLPGVADLLDPAAVGPRHGGAGDPGDLRQQVVVVEHGRLGDLAQALGAEGHHPGVGAHHVGGDAEEGADLADRALGGAQGVDLPLPVRGLGVLDPVDDRSGQEGHQRRRDAAGAGRRSAAGVRGGEGLVQVEVTQVEAGFAGTGDAEDAVGVGLVVAGQAAGLVDQVDELLDPRVEDPGVLRVGDHQGGGAGPDGRPQRLDVRVALGVRHQGDHLVAGDLGAGRVRGVREHRGDHLVPLPALGPRGVVGADHGDVGVDRRGARTRLQ